MCSDQSPWVVNDDLAYGFAAVGSASAACCQCYQLTFMSGSVAGKRMIVQATNTGSDVGETQFDLAMPGGGFGIFDGCSKQWAATPLIWGAQYGGSSTNTCSAFPNKLQAGCGFRWGSFFQGADNPSVNWETVACPVELTSKSGCVRKGDTPVSGPGAGVPPAISSTTQVVPIISQPSTLSTAIATSTAPPATSSSSPSTSAGTTSTPAIPIVIQPTPGSSSSTAEASVSTITLVPSTLVTRTTTPATTKNAIQPVETGSDSATGNDDSDDGGDDDGDSEDDGNVGACGA